MFQLRASCSFEEICRGGVIWKIRGGRVGEGGKRFRRGRGEGDSPVSPKPVLPKPVLPKPVPLNRASCSKTLVFFQAFTPF